MTPIDDGPRYRGAALGAALEQSWPRKHPAGAAALVARNQARTLAEQRISLGLSRTQVAERMGVPPQRVAAIEGAEPGAVGVRVLAAFVQALGGQLEIAADFGGQRVLLR